MNDRITNDDKDVTKKQFLHWNVEELMHVAAHRLRIYLELYGPAEYELVRHLKLHNRDQLHLFWARYLPRTVTNDFNQEEPSFSYILRHTQMLPRHVIMILNAAFANSGVFGTGQPIKGESLVTAVKKNEESFHNTIVKMFKHQYPLLRQVLEKIMPRLSRVMKYGHLHKMWRESAEDLMKQMGRETFQDFQRMMLAIGALGVVENREETALYISGKFEFNTGKQVYASDQHSFCVHPIFSGVYTCLDPEGAEPKPILTRDTERESLWSD